MFCRHLCIGISITAVAFGVTDAGAAVRLASNSGELAAAIHAARPGDELVLRDGTWRDVRIVFEANGTAAAPITLRAATPGGVVLTGKSRLQIGGKHLVVSGLHFRAIDGDQTPVEFRTGSSVASDCRLTECAIADCNPPNRKTNTKWLSLYGRRNRVDHCYLAGKTNLGTTLVVWLDEQPNEHRIDHNHFGPRPPLGENGGETIRVGTSDWSMHVSRTIVEANLFTRCDGEVEIISNKSVENVYRHNTFVDCDGALTLRHGNRCVVEGNFFFGHHRPGTGGVRVIGEDHRVVNNYFCELAGTGPKSALSLMQGVPNSPLAGYFQVKRTLIAFNTFIDCAASMVVGQPGSRASLPPEDVVIANNFFRVRRGGVLLQQPVAPVRLKTAGNVASGATAEEARWLGAKIADSAGVTKGEDGVWRLSEESVLRGAAVGDFGAVTDDIEGQPRGAEKDVGCDQFSREPARFGPLGADAVGPSWWAESGR